MPILVDCARVSGFRGIENIEIGLSRLCIFIGPNNAGKTSLIKAIQLAMGDYSRQVSEEDFHINNSDVRVKEIIVDIRIVPTDAEFQRVNHFEPEWRHIFGDGIQVEAGQRQFLGIRTSCSFDELLGTYSITRKQLLVWADFSVWRDKGYVGKKLQARIENVPFLAVDAQRDLRQDLRDRTSYVGRLLSSIEYSEELTAQIEEMVEGLNAKTIQNSPELLALKTQLEFLNQSFQGVGSVDISPIARKTRDLFRSFSVSLGNTEENIYPMEYHGMGTRSWASMLALSAFVNLASLKHQQEVAPFFPIMALEEPEAHLHPNAQRSLYRQLSKSLGQIIISTHSPYVVGISDPTEIRSFRTIEKGVSIAQININRPPEQLRKIRREVMHAKGEILFTKALALCEGETEEQALPILFAEYFNREPFDLGVYFASVGGSTERYQPYLQVATDLSIPWFIFSDGEEQTVGGLESVYKAIFPERGLAEAANIVILPPGNDFEQYLADSGYLEVLRLAIYDADGPDAITKYMDANHGKPYPKNRGVRDYKSADGEMRAILDILEKGKTRFSPRIASRIAELGPEKYPPKIRDFFEQIRGIS